MARKPYEKRTDLERCQSQWRKLQGLHSRDEWSAAIVRAATAAEIATNYSIRAEFKKQSHVSKEFVDSQLKWANGIEGKITRILVPLTDGTDKAEEIALLIPVVREINKTRNDIVHRGEFRDEAEATATIEHSRHFIETLVRLYKPKFKLQDKNKEATT
jgi:hypothetical protein